MPHRQTNGMAWPTGQFHMYVGSAYVCLEYANKASFTPYLSGQYPAAKDQAGLASSQELSLILNPVTWTIIFRLSCIGKDNAT